MHMWTAIFQQHQSRSISRNACRNTHGLHKSFDCILKLGHDRQICIISSTNLFKISRPLSLPYIPQCRNVEYTMESRFQLEPTFFQFLYSIKDGHDTVPHAAERPARRNSTMISGVVVSARTKCPCTMHYDS